MRNLRRADQNSESGNLVSRRNYFSWRAAALLGVVFVVFLTLAVPAKNLFDQQNRISNLQEQQNSNLELIEKLEAEMDRWQDPAFVRAQARERLSYVMPHEVGYIVLEAEEIPAAVSYRLGSTGGGEPWFEIVADSLIAAGDTAAPLSGVTND